MLFTIKSLSGEITAVDYWMVYSQTPDNPVMLQFHDQN